MRPGGVDVHAHDVALGVDAPGHRHDRPAAWSEGDADAGRIAYLAVDPYLEPWRDDPRVRDLMRRAGLLE